MNTKLGLKLGITSVICTIAIAGLSQISQANLTAAGRRGVQAPELSSGDSPLSSQAPDSKSGVPMTSEPSKHDSTEVLIAQTTALMSGPFMAAEAPTTGMAQIVEENGERYLVIDSAFSTTDQAPDLQVLLDTVEQPPATYEGADFNRYLNLGGLQSVTGEQRYPLPEFVDASQFKSVVIWCRMANATIGFASLADESSANAN